jgi:hypothetical protein
MSTKVLSRQRAPLKEPRNLVSEVRAKRHDRSNPPILRAPRAALRSWKDRAVAANTRAALRLWNLPVLSLAGLLAVNNEARERKPKLLLQRQLLKITS